MSGSSTRPRLVGVVASVLAHGLCAAVLAWLPTPEPLHPASVPEAIVVELVSVVPSATRPEGSTSGPKPPEAPKPVPADPPQAHRRSSTSPRPATPDPEAGRLEPPRPSSGGGLNLRGHRAADSGAPPAPLPLQLPPPPTSLVRPLGPRPRPERKPDDVAPALGDFGFVRGSGGTAVRDDPALPFIATIHPDGRVAFRHRKRGPLKYYALKTRIQKETFSLRLAMVRRWSRAQTRARLGALQRELRELWSSPLEAAARRRLLFELWDECLERSLEAEGVESALDRERAQVGVRARAIILKFVATELPLSSPNAYTPAELRRLNTRRVSRSRFEPYVRDRSKRPAG